MNINIWTKRHFTKNSTIEWSCPNCSSQSLFIVKDKLFDFQTAESTKMREEDEFWDPEWLRFVFSGALKCKKCTEFITFTGTGYTEESGYYDQDDDQYYTFHDEVFIPTFFQPTLRIFEFPEKCPENVKNEITDSFKLFWTDLPSCANKIRTSLEIIMNEEKVKRYSIKNGKRFQISLHNRIVNYKNKELSELLLAVKWIGNTGSHIGNIETIDILEAYKLLEYTLTKLYDNKEKDIIKISKEINKLKGVRKRK